MSVNACRLLGWLLLVPAEAFAGGAELHYEHGLLSAQIEGASLASVLNEIEAQTGTQVRFIDRNARAWRVHASFKDMPLERALRHILKDMSYVYCRDRNASTVHVLASAASRQLPAAPEELAPGGVSPDPGIASALAALSGNESTSQLMAAVQLAGSQDEHVIHALMNTAAGAVDPIDVRVEAASAIAQSALATPATDSTATNALRQLSRNNEPHVRQVAQSTLRDIETQRKEIEQVEREERGG